MQDLTLFDPDPAMEALRQHGESTSGKSDERARIWQTCHFFSQWS
jgi:hypothetical protein